MPAIGKSIAAAALVAGGALALVATGALSARPDPGGAVAALAPTLAEKGMRAGMPVFVRIFKEEAELEVWLDTGAAYELFRIYPICAHSGVLGPKLAEGDRQAPEGFYFVTERALNPNSRYHLSFDLGFPNAYDRARGRTGSWLMVHGACVSIGCYAMTDAGIEEIYGLAEAALDAGQPFFRVHAFPFRMTETNMARHVGSEWTDFWTNLQAGYAFFEETRRPPNVTVRDERYHFETTETPT